MRPGSYIETYKKIRHMKRNIRFGDGIISGIDKAYIIEILPQLKDSFQRKTHFEYYFEDTVVKLTLEQLDALSTEFRITMGYEDITIEV
jgi:hypothetical protein